MKYIFILFSLLILIQCSSSKKIAKATNPPGTVQINDTLFVDETEMTNIGWREYLSFIKTYYKNEDQLIYAIPDTTVWNNNSNNLSPFRSFYFRFPAYNFYPVVGVSYTQVLDFCKCRTHAVNLLSYMKEHNIHGSKEIEKIINDSIPIKFYYRLPTEKEWELIAKGNSKTTLNEYGYDRITDNIKDKQKRMFNAVYPAPFKSDSNTITSPTKSYYPNFYKTYNMIGNIAEMVQEPGIAKGGCYKDSVSNCKIAMRQYFRQPQNWLGFRCVAVKL